MNTQARATDPITSHIARTSQNLPHRIVLYLEDHGPSTTKEIVRGLNVNRTPCQKEVGIESVSTCMRPLCREGLIHELGTKRNPDTGNSNIVWAAGGDPNGNFMPVRRTGPQEKLKLRLFEKDDIIRICQVIADSGDPFQNLTDALNEELCKRVY